MPRLSKAEVVKQEGSAALTAKLAEAGFVAQPQLAREMSPGGLQNLLFLGERSTLFGQGGVEVAAAVEPSGGRKAWVLGVNVVLYSARADEVLAAAGGRERFRAGYLMVDLMELVMGKWRYSYRIGAYDPSDVDRVVSQITADVDQHAESWFSRFDDIDTGEEFLFDNPTQNFQVNHDGGLVAALGRGDLESARRFSAGTGSMWKPEIGQEHVEERADFYRRIGEQYGVELPLVTWDEVRART